MIHVDAAPEPEDFDLRVRQPGRAALSAGKDPLPDYWRRCLPELLARYGRVCAYCCIYIPRVVGGPSVEHLAPKSKHPDLAYEWRNYRLVCALMNSRKRDFEDVLDPFDVETGWFELLPPTWQVTPRRGLDADTRQAVVETIERLELNDAECREQREEDYLAYAEAAITFTWLAKVNPFVAREVDRQGLRRANDT